MISVAQISFILFLKMDFWLKHVPGLKLLFCCSGTLKENDFFPNIFIYFFNILPRNFTIFINSQLKKSLSLSLFSLFYFCDSLSALQTLKTLSDIDSFNLFKNTLLLVKLLYRRAYLTKYLTRIFLFVIINCLQTWEMCHLKCR